MFGIADVIDRRGGHQLLESHCVRQRSDPGPVATTTTTPASATATGVPPAPDAPPPLTGTHGFAYLVGVVSEESAVHTTRRAKDIELASSVTAAAPAAAVGNGGPSRGATGDPSPTRATATNTSLPTTNRASRRAVSREPRPGAAPLRPWA
jgi:hypothetical protein